MWFDFLIAPFSDLKILINNGFFFNYNLSDFKIWIYAERTIRQYMQISFRIKQKKRYNNYLDIHRLDS
jgi:hypothetical protein